MPELAEIEEKCECITIRPAADVVETPDGMELTFEIPGTAADQVALEIRERLLTLTAKSSLHRRGLPVVYKRAFYLSDAVHTAGITAKAADGLLTVWVPKAENARTHRITVE
ncbi:MAG: Hsp20/alpha crystallin family protein [Lentisphaeria bacterium]|nr:Hsp20/alpha crystallin family protein [Lentisphaeria bacterium]